MGGEHMDIFSVISIFGGLALFLYGMHVLSAGLEKTAGGKMEAVLGKMTSNRLKGLLLGVGVTALIQSSSAVTVMLVGLVNSGIMSLTGAISVTMGSNIGTTVTAWVLSLTGIDSSNVWVNLLKPANFSPIIAFIGIILIKAGKKQKLKDAGSICVGFAVLMYGMTVMSGEAEKLTEVPGFTGILTFFSNPVMGVITGMILTAVIQSSSVSVGILQALSMTGTITYGTAIPIIMGQNIGACTSAVIASFGASKKAKCVAVANVLFKVIGTVIGLSAWLIADAVIDSNLADSVVSPFNIAVIHTVFNIFSTVILLPFAKQLEKISNVLVRDSKKKDEKVLLDERLMTVPSFAVAKAADVTAEMASLAKKSVKTAVGLLEKYDEKTAQSVKDMEAKIDSYEDALGTYLVKISKKDINDSDSKQISKLLHTISDFERIGDHANNILGTAREMHEKKIRFSPDALEETDNLTEAIFEILSITVKAFKNDDISLAETVEPLEQVIDRLIADIKMRHIARLKKGECTIEVGFVLTDLLTNCERISDHCSNIAVAVIDAQRGNFDSHEYLNQVKSENTGTYAEYYERYLKKYSI